MKHDVLKMRFNVVCFKCFFLIKCINVSVQMTMLILFIGELYAYAMYEI